MLAGFGGWKIERVAGLTDGVERLIALFEVFKSLLLVLLGFHSRASRWAS